MSKKKSRWGIFLFSAAVLLSLLVIRLNFVYPPSENSVLYEKVIRYIGLLSALLSFFAGHFSYPRVHNLKVYLAGYLFGLTGITFFIASEYAVMPGELTAVIKMIITANLLLVVGVPSFVKYSITKVVTFSLLLTETVVIIYFWIDNEAAARAAEFIPVDAFQFMFWLLPICLLIVGVFTYMRMREEFFLGGFFTGITFICTAAWIVPVLFVADSRLSSSLIYCAALYLDLGIILHWYFRMEHRVSYDPLLHIYNRSYCSKIIAEQSNISSSPPFTVAMIDIDHFKKVNDKYGHQAGDQVLISVAQTIQREALPRGIVCRYGGEEIIVFFPKTDIKKVVPVAERIREQIESMSITARRKKIKVTVSCGVSSRESSNQSVMDVINTADKALYRVKNSGRNNVKRAKTPIKKKK